MFYVNDAVTFGRKERAANMVRETRYLWVANLPDTVNEEQIAEYFGRQGAVCVCLPSDCVCLQVARSWADRVWMCLRWIYPQYSYWIIVSNPQLPDYSRLVHLD